MNTAAARHALAALKQAMTRSDRAGVNDACRALVDGDAPLGSQWKAVATVLQHNGEHSLAKRAAASWVRQSDGALPARFEETAVLARAGRPQDASTMLETLPEDFPNAAGNAFMRGTMAINLGQMDQARAHFRDAVRVDPSAGQAWLALAMAGPVADDDALALAAASVEMERAPPLAQSAWFYALGKMHADRDAHDAAFAAFAQGAALMREARPYDAAADAARAEAARWTAAQIAAGTLGAAAPSRPIFVTGLPRSGTTLVEQILASHSAIAGGEELGLFRLLEQDIGGRSYADLARYLESGGSLSALRGLYDHLLGERYPGTAHVVDKTLGASRYMGLAATLFPDAPILWLRRDPLDCAWSAYRTWFLQGLDWSWSPTDIAAHFRIEDGLFEYWTAVLGDRVLVVDYALLVTDPASQIARIATHCGLDLEPGQLRPQDTVRAVTTSSVAQVRAPINTRAIDAAGPYRRYLQPFVDAYGYPG